MNASIGIVLTGLFVAFIARRFGTRWSGLTFTRRSGTRYVPFNVVAFWFLIAVTAVIWVLYWSGR